MSPSVPRHHYWLQHPVTEEQRGSVQVQVRLDHGSLSSVAPAISKHSSIKLCHKTTVIVRTVFISINNNNMSGRPWACCVITLNLVTHPHGRPPIIKFCNSKNFALCGPFLRISSYSAILKQLNFGTPTPWKWLPQMGQMFYQQSTRGDIAARPANLAQ